MRKLKLFYNIPSKEWRFPPSVASSESTSSKKLMPTESVRQWILRELFDSYSYPPEWFEARLSFKGPGPEFEYGKGLLGLCVLTTSGDPFLWVVVGKQGEAVEAEKALRVCLREAPYARMGLSTDGTAEGTKTLRRRSDNGECEFTIDIESYIKPGLLSGPEPAVAPVGGHRDRNKGRALEALTSSFENVFFEAHSHIRDIDGLHADEALDELCKYIYTKLFDEEFTEQGKPYRLQRWLYGSTEEFAAAIRHLYHEANEYDVRVFSLKIPGYDRSRGVFGTDIRLSSSALFKVAETLQDYNLSASGIDVKGRAFQKVLWPSVRAGMGQYFTPHEVIEFVVDIIDPSINELVLDPFSGSGHFLTRSLDVVRRKSKDKSHKQLNEFAFNKLHGIEKSDRMARVAMTDMRLHGDGHANIRCTDSLMDFANYPDIRPESFDVIMTNPPFGSLLGADAIARLGHFDLAVGKKNVPLEVLGLERCVQFLRPGGRMGIVIPDGILANRGTQSVRVWLEQWAKTCAVVSLPIETFAPFGANIKTSILVLRKWKKGEHRASNYPVRMARVDNVGYEATGRIREGSEFKEVSRDLREFLDKEGW